MDVVDMRSALAEVDRIVHTTVGPRYLVAGNPEKIYAARKNPFLKEFFQNAALIIPDGIGIVLALRCLYGLRVERVPGADLMQNICAMAPHCGYRIFIYGASEETNAGAVRQLQMRHPGIEIVGRAHGYLKECEMPALIDRINRSQADVLFVAMGSPRQEEWLNHWLPQLNVKICQGIGGTLDTIVGKVKRAPKAWQRMGLEWLYRLLREPRRITRQWRLATFAMEVLIKRVIRDLRFEMGDWSCEDYFESGIDGAINKSSKRNY
jgi:N-acetylglucosaminyldiphosphoundecaprenol N-acetyl-beta-D-mannosaminyltransferase